MQNFTSTLSAGRQREAECRRASVMTVIYAVAILATLALGLTAIISFGSRIVFYGSIAGAAALSDPLRKNLSQIVG